MGRSPPPSMTTRDRELVFGLEVRIERGFEPETSDSAVQHSTNSKKTKKRKLKISM